MGDVTKKDRFLYLDALRGIAAVVVMLHHYFFIYNQEFGHPFAFPGILEHGYFGVELFFLISGFVIFYTLSNTVSIKQFLLKRIIRLYPTYWICLIITFCVIHIFPLSASRNTTIKDALVGLTMFNSLIKIKSVDPSYWTLLVEWFFYLMLAGVMLFLRNKTIGFYRFLWGWLALIMFYTLVYHIPVAGAFFNLRYGSFFVSGICFYEIYINKQKGYQYWLLLSASLIVGFFALADLKYSNFAIITIYMIFGLTLHFKFHFLSWKVFLFFGEISYALYLIHQNVGFIVMRQLEQLGVINIWKVFIAIAISTLLATIITKKIAMPISVRLKQMIT